MSYIGIDVGTSSIKGLLVDEELNIVDSASRSYEVNYFNEGYSEQNPDDWYNGAIEIIKELSNDCVLNIKGISFSGQMHGLVILDENDKVIRPAILWNDQRTIAEVNYLNNEIGEDVLRAETGNIALTGYTLPKILWVKNNEADNFNKIDKVMLPKDYIAYKLSGVFASDVSDLSGTLLLDVKNRMYSKKMIDISGLKREQLPDIYESFDVVGELNNAEFNFKNQVKIIIGGGDQAVGAIGTNTIRDGDVNISLGTSGVVYRARNKFKLSENHITHHFCDATGNYLEMGVALATGSSVKWFYEDILKYSDYSDLESKLYKSKENKIYFLPYLSGERSPLNDPNIRGGFLGLSTQTSEIDMLRSVIEGTSFSLYSIYESLGISDSTSFKITGGGSKNRFYIETVCNVFQCDISTINSNEGPALGAAILAISACSKKSITCICDEIIKNKDTISPTSNLRNKYIKFKEITRVISEVQL